MLCPDLTPVEVGTVAEQYVRYKLLRWGYQAIMMEQGNDYDLLIVNGDRFIRLQVKSSARIDESRGKSYKFNIGKGSSSKVPYSAKCIDGFALVALDQERVLFMAPQEKASKRIGYGTFSNCEHQSWLDLLDHLANK